MEPRRLGWFGVVILLVALLSAVGLTRTVAQHPLRHDVPHIELRAPDAFDGRVTSRRPRASVRYQVSATVQVPLLFTGLPIVSRDEVGFSSAAWSDRSVDGSTHLRTYEFFAASIPEEARGLNRLGFLLEVVALGPEGARWTAHYGGISSNREGSRQDAVRNLDRDERIQPITILDGFTDSRQIVNSRVELDVEGRWRTASELYAEVRPRWLRAEVGEEMTQSNTEGRLYREPVGFLGGLQHSLRVAAMDLAMGESPRPFRYTFVHSGEIFHLDLRDHALDDRRRGEYADAGLVPPDTPLHKLDYRIVRSGGGTVEGFELWTTLPGERFDPLAPPVIPVAFEFNARSFLKLRAVRTLDGASS